MKVAIIVGKIEIKWKEMEEQITAGKFISDTSGQFLYISHLKGVSKLDTETWERTLVAGSIADSDDGPKNGHLLEARFYCEYIFGNRVNCAIS